MQLYNSTCIAKLPNPKGRWTLPGHKYSAPYNDLDKQVRIDPKTTKILEIYDPPTGKTDAISDAISMLIKKIFKEGRVPKYLWTDKRKEYYNKSLKEVLDKNKIVLYSAENEEKSSAAERWNRTMKGRMWKRFTAQNSTESVDILPGLLREYNNTKHFSFYEQEILKVELPQDSLFRIEKMIRRDNKLGRTLVKWSGYPDII